MRLPIPQIACVLHLGAIALMALTGYIPLLLGGAPHGYTLLVHGGGAAFYLLTLGLIAVVYSGADNLTLPTRLTLALLLWSGIATAATMILAMTNLAATDGQRLLIAIHRWSSIPATLSGIVFSMIGLMVLRPKPQHEGVNP
ncbi:MAG: hypothetical protein JJU11_04785 [Candidatus Sumerlaeia bacterium]|nr:hypothetical protein [Candidatus Sumerlaeia bacterium]